MPLAFPQPLHARLASAGITIAASTWRWDGVSGSVRVSSGFALQPGQLTAANANTFRVYVGGVEQAIALNPLDGGFPDGSYRSPGVQFLYTLTNDTPVAAEIRINQGVRGTTDIAWVEPTRVSVRNRAVIAPTDPAHLCGTMVTLTPLTPASNDTGTDATWAAYAASSWLSDPQIYTGSAGSTAIYDHVNGHWNLYCRTGARIWYQRAYDWATAFHGESGIANNDSAAGLTLMESLLPSAESSPGVPQPVGACSDATQWNPQDLRNTISNGDCGNPNEAMGWGRWISLASSYWMTAYRQFKRLIALNANFGLYQTASGYPTYRDRCLSTVYGQRYNARYIYASVLLGYLTGCTTGLTFPGGYPPVTTWDYATYIDWILDALEYHVWNLPGDYRNGLVGQRHGTISVPDDAASGHPGTGTNWGVTNFQLSVITELLTLYYDNIAPDSRIPPWIKIICDYWISQTKPAEPGDSRYPEGAAWMSSYINLPPVAAATPTFTANAVSGSADLTFTGGNLPRDFFQPGHSFTGPGIQTGTHVGKLGFPLLGDGSHGGVLIDTTIKMTTSDLLTPLPATAPGTNIVCRVFFNPYDLPEYFLTFAWYYAYSGTTLYNTWATRCSDNIANMAAMTGTKNWGQLFGGLKQGALYYRHGGTVRGIPGAHPATIVNPPLQPVLG